MAKQSIPRNDEVAMPRKEEFLDRLQELAAASCNTRSGRHRAAFLAVRELVDAAPCATWPNCCAPAYLRFDL